MELPQRENRNIIIDNNNSHIKKLAKLEKLIRLSNKTSTSHSQSISLVHPESVINNPACEEDEYGAYYNQIENEETSPDLCSLQIQTSLSVPEKEAILHRPQQYEYAFKEIIDSESNYIAKLEAFLRIRHTLSCFLSSEESSAIFHYDVENLYEIHNGFYRQLRKVKNAAELGQVFLHWRKKFAISYDYFCSNTKTAKALLQELCNKNKLLNKELIKWEEDEEKKETKYKVMNLFEAPWQHIMRYPILFNELLKNIPRERTEELCQLKKVLEVVDDISKYVNYFKNDYESLTEIKNIETSIVNWDPTIELKKYGRLLKSGKVKVATHDNSKPKKKKRQIFILQQAIVICKMVNNKNDCKIILKLIDCQLQDHPSFNKNSIYLEHKDYPKQFIQLATTQKKKPIWIKILQDTIDNINQPTCTTTTHKFILHTFNEARTCQGCNKFLLRCISQGYLCKVCEVAVHKECVLECSVLCDGGLSLKLWFAGTMTYNVAEKKLKGCKDETYMLRLTPAENPNLKDERNYEISLMASGCVKHMKVLTRVDDNADLYYLDEKRLFKSVIQLVEYYQRNSLAESFPDINKKLIWPFKSGVAKVLCNFNAWGPNQLQLRKGFPVKVLSQETDLQYMWYGKTGSAVGSFPKKCVELVRE